MLAVIATAPSKARPAASCGNPKPNPTHRARSGNADSSKPPSLKRRAAPPLSVRGLPPDGRAR